MFSYLISAFNYFFPKSYQNADDEDDDKEHFLSEQLLELEADQQDRYNIDIPATPAQIPRHTECFERTGKLFK